VLAACARHGKKAGMLLRAGMSAAACRQKGFSFLALGSDGGCLRQGFDQLIKGV
jgi:2-keto-3-deoxy-L-rhamnonate aldolase RhmA